ncbi:MAG: amidohydrolase family protein [Pseudomonadota bacterium]
MLKPNMAVKNDQDGLTVPEGLPTLIDAHVHIFPDTVFRAIWKWFDENAWPIRYQMSTRQIFTFLLSRKVKHIIALQYAHKPGIARYLNQYMAQECREFNHQVTGMATVFPGEEDAQTILQDAFDSGLGGLKLHAHVQCFDMNADHMNGLYECARINQKPVIMHVGREPNSPAYACDPYQLCSAEKLERILKEFPDLKVCVPHLGFDEIGAYQKMIETYDNLWLDTTMVISDYFPIQEKLGLEQYRSDRIMYGSDFPNIPYAWDSELRELKNSGLAPDTLEKITHKNAIAFFNLNL